jgi:3-oxoacyl-[acyl-carrier protein] reductase
VFLKIATLAGLKRIVASSAHVKHLVITGAGGDLGKALAASFAQSCWVVGTPDRRALDVTDPATIGSYFESRPLDLLVCAAGIIRDASLGRIRENQWDEVFSVNYQGAADCAAAALPGMIRQGHGHIVFISSYSALHPSAGQSAYAASKAALLGLVADLATRHGPSNIRVNAVLPGFMETRMTETVSNARKAEILADHALRRFNAPAAVAKFIRHLHEDLAHTSGQVFQLDSRVF